MRTFFQRWKFKHPTTQDFIEVANKIVDHDLGSFFQQYLETSATLDYQVATVSENIVTIKKAGELIFPVRIEFVFEDGQRMVKEWDGRKNIVTYDFEEMSELVSISIDPENIIEFELSKRNNVWERSASD